MSGPQKTSTPAPKRSELNEDKDTGIIEGDNPGPTDTAPNQIGAAPISTPTVITTARSKHSVYTRTFKRV